MTARPSGAFCLTPSPRPSDIGSIPWTIAVAVFSTGRRRVRPASSAEDDGRDDAEPQTAEGCIHRLRLPGEEDRRATGQLRAELVDELLHAGRDRPQVRSVDVGLHVERADDVVVSDVRRPEQVRDARY